MRNPNSALEAEPGTLETLVELALDLRHCWDHTTDPVWLGIEPELWRLTHNPWVVLQTASRTKLKALESDAEFCKRVRELLNRQRQDLKTEAWFQRAHGDSRLSCVAYFSMEFGLSEALPIYSGGLGNVAGDQLKAASDLGVPLVGVGLLYQQGYFRQIIEADGSQRALYPYNDPGQLPITPVRDKDGEWFRLSVILPGQTFWLRAWQAQVGRLRLYLLDSNDPANPPAYRGITSELYGGGPELRLVQELALGIGGWRLLRGLGIKPEVCHLNEGHAAFAVLERARSFMEDNGQPFEVSLAVTRAGNLFTTHTPVEAGFDRFAPSLIGRYLERYARERLGIDLSHLLALGRGVPGDANEPFNMAYLAIRGSGTINGVSRLHGAVSQHIFQCLFPHWPVAEVPVGYVTNGVHTPTWDSAAADKLWTEACGRERWRGSMESLGENICRAADSALWEVRAKNRLELVRFVRERLASQLAARGGDPKTAESIFDPETLTLGFARRFATYKRPNMLLHDPERLVRILTNPQRPVQLVIAGKAHPQDAAGQAMIKAWVEFVQRPDVRRHAVFLSDYDLVLAERLVQGADLWINTPRRPWEACGTSGMKVLVNGGLNLSELDGWWAEAYSPQVGWALGDGKEHGDDPAWDAAEAEELYDILEKKVIPSFYNRDNNGIATEWVARMRASMSRLTPRFSANRAVREYTDKYYLPAAAAYYERTHHQGAYGRSLLQWEQALAEHWAPPRFGELRVKSSPQKHSLQVEVNLGELRTDWVRVQLYADPLDGEPPFVSEMTQTDGAAPSSGWRVYAADVPASRPASDYTPRIVPSHSGARIPLEEAHIRWFR
ncbi:MAG: alpha-glucan family phosphorylase [Candidatus Binataceae bacterium]